MPNLHSVYSGKCVLSVISPSSFADSNSFALPGLPSSTDEALLLLRFEKDLFEALDGRIFNPAAIRVGNSSVVEGRVCVALKICEGTPVRLLAYQSSGSHVASTGKLAGEWFVFLGFAQSGWFVKTAKLVQGCLGNNSYLASLSQYLQIAKLGERVHFHSEVLAGLKSA